ncbi:MAG: Fur family transcriptional regulator [Pseudomonadota bacterium]
MSSEPTLSKNQRVVLDALRAGGQAMSAYQVLGTESVRASGLKAPLTIYRALDKLIALGLVHRIESMNAFIPCKHAPHHHAAVLMICESCHRTIEVATSDVERSINAEARAAGFAVKRVSIEVSGRCDACDE